MIRPTVSFLLYKIGLKFKCVFSDIMQYSGPVPKLFCPNIFSKFFCHFCSIEKMFIKRLILKPRWIPSRMSIIFWNNKPPPNGH